MRSPRRQPLRLANPFRAHKQRRSPTRRGIPGTSLTSASPFVKNGIRLVAGARYVDTSISVWNATPVPTASLRAPWRKRRQERTQEGSGSLPFAPTETTVVAELHNTLIHASCIPCTSSRPIVSITDDQLSHSSTALEESSDLLSDDDVHDSLVGEYTDCVTDHYQYTKDLCELDACRPQCPVAQIPPEACTVVTPLPREHWERALADHPDRL